MEDNGGQDCQCDATFLTGSQFALCGAESTCRLDCQRRGSVAHIVFLIRTFLTSLTTHNTNSHLNGNYHKLKLSTQHLISLNFHFSPGHISDLNTNYHLSSLLISPFTGWPLVTVMAGTASASLIRNNPAD